MRVFIALELPEELKDKIFTLSQKATKGLKIKLVERENLHVTLIFLGEVSEDNIEKIKGVLRSTKGVGEISLKAERIESFPPKGLPHGVWLSLEGQKEKLFSLYKKIVDGMLSVGIKLKERKLRFSPHITLGRFKERDNKFKKIEKSIKVSDEFVVRNVTLFSSKLSSKGSVYSKIAEFEL